MKKPSIHQHLFAAAGMVACVVMAQAAVPAAPEDKPAATNDMDALHDSIQREATRQDQISAGIVELNRELRVFIQDLETNQIYKDVEGPTVSTAVSKLDDTNDDFVRGAAGSLRSAADQPEARHDQLASASGDIKSAIDVLTELMKLTDSYRGQSLLEEEVGHIIRSMEEAIEKSAKLDQEMAEGTQPEARRFDELAAEQEKIAARTESLRELLRQAEKDAFTDTEKERLAHVADVMSENPADSSMRKAGQDIREGDMVSALGEQHQALEGMQKLSEALKKPEESMRAEVKKSMENILAEQAQLRERTEAMDKAEMANKAEDLQGEQKELMDRLAELAQGEPMPKAPPSNATKAKGPDPEEPAPPTEGGAEDGGEGKKGGGSNTGAGQGSKKSPPRDRPPMEGGAPGQKPGGMGSAPQEKAQQALAQQEKAEQALAKKDQAAAATAQREAEQALAEAIEQMSDEQADGMPLADAESQPGEGKPGEGKPGEGKPGEGKPGEGKPGEGKPGAGKPGQGKPGKGTMPGKGSSGIASKNVYGVAPEDDETTWQPLNDEDRAGLGENFARELPREYRDMLKAYYEQLAK